MSQIEYFKVPKGFSDQVDRLSWSESCDAIVVEGGWTLALGTALAQFIEGALRDTQPIHFAYLLHFLASTKYEDDQWRRLHDLGFAVNRNSGALFAVLTRQVPRLDFDFDMPEARRLLLQQTELVPVHWLETGSPELAIDVASFESGVSRVLASMTREDIVYWLRHGRGALPNTEPPPELPKREQTFTELIEKLLKSPRLAGVSDLMQQVVAAVSIPPRSQRRTELPVGGYSSIVSRGQPDQILMSEHAVDELEFLRRYANNELLYWQREEPQNQQAEELCIVLDQGVRTWGEPRLALTAAALALGKQAEKRNLPCEFVFTSNVMRTSRPQKSGADIAEGKLAGSCTARPQMSAPLFENSDLTSNPAQALRQALSEDSTVNDTILLTHPKNLDEPEIAHAASQQSENQRLFAITVDEQGNGTLQQLTTSGRIQLRTFKLNIQPPKTEQSKPEVEPTKDRQWTGDIGEVTCPFNIGFVSDIEKVCLCEDAITVLVRCKNDVICSVDGTDNSIECLPSIIDRGSILSNIMCPGQNGVLLNWRDSVEVNYSIWSFVDLKARTIHSQKNDLIRGVMAYSKTLDGFVSYDRIDAIVKIESGKPVTTRLSIDRQEAQNCYRELFVSTTNPGFIERENEFGCHFQVDTGIFYIRIPNRELFQISSFAQAKHTTGRFDHTKQMYIEWTDQLLALWGTSKHSHNKSALFVYRLSDRQLIKEFSFRGEGHMLVSLSGNRMALAVKQRVLQIWEILPEPKLVAQTAKFQNHGSLHSELGQNWLTLHGGKFTHLLRWDRGPLEISFMQGQKNIGEFVQKRRDTSVLNPHGSTATPNKLTETFRQRWQKQCFKGNLTLLSDSTGNVAVLGDEDKLIVMFHVYRGTIAAWMPDGTRYGPASLTGGPTTKGALDSIGVALSEASL